MLIVPDEFDANFISSLFYPDDVRNDTLSRINGGECYDWAYYAVRTFHRLPLELHSTYAHAWVVYQGKAYDSVAANGVYHWEDLETNRWWRGTPEIKSINEFMAFWNRNGGGRKNHWDSYLEKNLSQNLGINYLPRELQVANYGSLSL